MIKQSIAEFKSLESKLKTIAASHEILKVGDVVILKNGEEQTISKISFGEAQGENAFFRWNAFFPFDIEHAAMEDSMQIVDVKIAK
jgi:hypothetical protein